MHADAAEVFLQARDDLAVAPLAGVVGRDVVAQLGPQLGGHVDEVLALVAVYGRLLTLVAGVEGVPELRELVPGVVQVVLAVHLGALRGQEVGDAVADRHPTPASRVEWTSGVGGDELQVDPPPHQRGARAVRDTPGDHDVKNVVQPGFGEHEVEVAGTRDVDPLEMLDVLGDEGRLDPLRDLAGISPDCSS